MQFVKTNLLWTFFCVCVSKCWGLLLYTCSIVLSNGCIESLVLKCIRLKGLKNYYYRKTVKTRK